MVIKWCHNLEVAPSVSSFPRFELIICYFYTCSTIPSSTQGVDLKKLILTFASCNSSILIGLAVMVYELLYHIWYMVGVRVSLKLEASWEFCFAKDRTAPEAKCFNSFLRILEMQFHRKTKTNKKASSACLKVCRKTHGNTWTKVPWPATKEDKCCFFMIAKPFADRVTRW